MKTLKEITTNGMTHDQWLDLRRKSIGGSDAATVVGLNPYSCAYELWADKLGKLPPKEENEAMRLGHDLEDYVAKRFTEATGKKVRRKNAVIYNPDLPFAHANVDRLVIGEDAGLECKTTSVLNLKKFRDGDFPANYYVQCQHYMMVTVLPKWYLAVLVLGKEFLWYEITRNEEDIAALEAAEREFWQFVESETEPPVDGTDACEKVIGALYPDGKADEIDLTPFGSELAAREKLAKQIAELTELKKKFDNEIKSYMKDAEYGSCGGYKITWKNVSRTNFDHKKYISEHENEDFTDYFKTSQYRTFKVVADE